MSSYTKEIDPWNSSDNWKAIYGISSSKDVMIDSVRFKKDWNEKLNYKKFNSKLLTLKCDFRDENSKLLYFIKGYQNGKILNNNEPYLLNKNVKEWYPLVVFYHNSQSCTISF